MNGRASVWLCLLCLVLCDVLQLAAEGNHEHRPSAEQFGLLSLEEQFALYLRSVAPGRDSLGQPEGTTYRDIIVSDNPASAVFELSKQYLQEVRFAYAAGDPRRFTTLADYRFSLLLNIWGAMSVEGRLAPEQVEWLARECERRVVEYIRSEKRIDENVLAVALFVDAQLISRQEYRGMSAEGYTRSVYLRYVVQMGLLPEEEVGLQVDLAFPGYTGRLVPR